MAKSASLRGVGLGSKSFEGTDGIVLSPRQSIEFDCPAGHHFTVVFSQEAELPATWDCTRCGDPAARSDGYQAAAQNVKPDRTHMDRLRERRTDLELEAILAERLQLIKDGVIGPNAYERIATKGAKKAAARR
ncbi:MAG TPA: RNA polymerase-binding protein RbpA [Propionibacteriaceae bacterium]